MNRAFGIIIAAPLLFISVFILLLIGEVKAEDRAFDEYVLTYAIDYATDAAVEEMLEMSKLGMDYQAWGFFYTNPDVAKETFEKLMVMQYDMPMTDRSMKAIETSIPVFCVCSYDGYYIYTQAVDSAGNYYLQSTLKMPYEMDGVANNVYCMNLGFENCRELDAAGKYNYLKISQCRIRDEKGTVRTVTKSDIQRRISKLVTDSLTYEFQHRTNWTNGYKEEIHYRDYCELYPF